MVLKEKQYIGSKEFCIKILKKKGHEEISMLAALSGVPCLMLCIWYIDYVKDEPIVHEYIKNIQNFYQYTAIERIQ